MCEPMQSTVQFCDPDDFDDDDENHGSPQSSRPAFIAKVGSWFKKIGRFFHVCKMGSGHSETLTSKKVNQFVEPTIHSFVQPEHVKWEADWTKRTVYLDSTNMKREKFLRLAKEAEKAANSYGEDVCIGGFTQFRRFFTESVRVTSNFYLPEYYNRFIYGMLNSNGIKSLSDRLAKIFGRKKTWSASTLGSSIAKLMSRKQATSLLLGYTRQRKLIVPEWADDDKLWQPPEKKLILPDFSK